jgi:hypothetical protein
LRTPGVYLRLIQRQPKRQQAAAQGTVRGAAQAAQRAGEECPASRDEMAWVSLCGGLALANAGLGVIHGLAGIQRQPKRQQAAAQGTVRGAAQAAQRAGEAVDHPQPARGVSAR